MKELKVELKEIKCIDPQDPRRDELYCITAVKGGSHSSKAVRQIERGDTICDFQPDQKLLFAGTVDEKSPIIITVMEQRAIQDDSILHSMLVKYAEQGLDIVNNKAQLKLENKSDLYKYLIKYIMGQVVNLFTTIFRDHALGYKVIPIPYEEGLDNVTEYHVKLKQEETPTYEYDLRIAVSYK